MTETRLNAKPYQRSDGDCCNRVRSADLTLAQPTDWARNETCLDVLAARSRNNVSRRDLPRWDLVGSPLRRKDRQGDEMADNAVKKRSWWLTLPGALTAMGTFIGAITGLLAILNQVGLIGPHTSPTTTPASVTSIESR